MSQLKNGIFFLVLFYAWCISALYTTPEKSRDTTVKNSNNKEKKSFLAKVQVTAPAGVINGRRSILGSETFAGIPYAEPPVGPLRLRPPKRLSKHLENHDGTGIAAACPQQYVDNDGRDAISKVGSTALKLPLFDRLTGQEDCLTITVQRPAGTKAGANLPVLFWIYGGGLIVGATNTYDATAFLQHGVATGKPFVFVAVNYRLNGFGFLPGKEILKDNSANLGLLDQRMGLEWVADNIAAFGGDASKVTIWGESAGAWSVMDQLLLYGGNASYKGSPLFHGAIMNSGALVPTAPVDSPQAQQVYDTVVRKAGCEQATDSLNCLREASYDNFYEAVTSVPTLLALNNPQFSYLVRPDGRVIPDNPVLLVKTGRFHAVPIISGNQEDEGTIFSIPNPKLSSTERIADHVSKYFLRDTPRELIIEYINTYPTSISSGSPYRTGVFNELFPGFKRLSAIIGDIILTLMRRITLELMKESKPNLPIWSYLASYEHGTPVLGTFHASDVLKMFYSPLPTYSTTSLRTYYLNFVYNSDPNVGGGGPYANWPQWGSDKKLLWFETQVGNSFLDDDFRESSAKILRDNIANITI